MTFKGNCWSPSTLSDLLKYIHDLSFIEQLCAKRHCISEMQNYLLCHLSASRLVRQYDVVNLRSKARPNTLFIIMYGLLYEEPAENLPVKL